MWACRPTPQKQGSARSQQAAHAVPLRPAALPTPARPCTSAAAPDPGWAGAASATGDALRPLGAPRARTPRVSPALGPCMLHSAPHAGGGRGRPASLTFQAAPPPSVRAAAAFSLLSASLAALRLSSSSGSPPGPSFCFVQQRASRLLLRPSSTARGPLLALLLASSASPAAASARCRPMARLIFFEGETAPALELTFNAPHPNHHPHAAAAAVRGALHLYGNATAKPGGFDASTTGNCVGGRLVPVPHQAHHSSARGGGAGGGGAGLGIGAGAARFALQRRYGEDCYPAVSPSDLLRAAGGWLVAPDAGAAVRHNGPDGPHRLPGVRRVLAILPPELAHSFLPWKRSSFGLTAPLLFRCRGGGGASGVPDVPGSDTARLVALAPLPRRPRVHVFPLPHRLSHPCAWFGCGELTAAVRGSGYAVDPDTDGLTADYTWYPLKSPLEPGETEDFFRYIRATPEWREQAAGRSTGNNATPPAPPRLLVPLTCDYGPGDCGYTPPAEAAADSPTRPVSHVVVNGMTGGPMYYQPGRDVAISIFENACGPLCGFSRAELREHSVWRSREAALSFLAEPPDSRPVVLFWGGTARNDTWPVDISGRTQVLQHAGVPGYRLVNTYDPLTTQEEHVKRRVPFLKEMLGATFCYSPLGFDGGQTDRYIAAMLLGCVPVVLRSAPAINSERGVEYPVSRVVLPLEEHPAIDWQSFAVVISFEEISQLSEILGKADVARLRRGIGSVWRRFLWSGIYGADGEGGGEGGYLGETPGVDAFESMMDVLGARLAREEAEAEAGARAGGGGA